MPGFVLSREVFVIISALIEERVGIHYELSDLTLLQDRIAPRAMEAGFDSLLDYYYYLRYDPASAPEFDRLVEALVVGETYFFREFDQVRALVEHVIEPKVAAGHRPKIWCAACSTGEEPLSLAMLLDDRGVLSKVDLLATDLSRKALTRAQSGRFSRRSLRQVPEPRLAERWLIEGPDGVDIRPGLREKISWSRINLLDPQAVARLAPCDVILCRNVLIYFTEETARRVVDSLARALAPGGALLVGVSESILRFGAGLTCEERGGAFIYNKGGGA